MDRTKTGALIAAARKEQNMTQKELAAALHVSDRAVSKWERVYFSGFNSLYFSSNFLGYFPL